jgi:hypothetical protein
MKTEYELLLRYQNDTELVVDVREDTVDADGETVNAEYIEGFIYDHWSLEKNYAEALKMFRELKDKYRVNYEFDEVEYYAEKLISIKQNDDRD